MPLLNPTEILPEAMRFLLRTLLASPNHTLDVDELRNFVAPTGLKAAMNSLRAGDASEGTESSTGAKIADDSLNALIDLGLAGRADGRVTATTAATSRWSTADDVDAPSFAQALRELIWNVAVDDVSPSAVNSKVDDLVSTLALLFVEPSPLAPLDFEAGDRPLADIQKRQFGESKNDWKTTNLEQWRSLRRWAPFLGLMRPISQSTFIVEASKALTRDLSPLPAGRYSIGDFIGRVAGVLPIADGGSLSRWQGPANELSPGLSLTIHMLRADGTLKILSHSDAEVRELVLGEQQHLRTPATHIDWQLPSGGIR